MSITRAEFEASLAALDPSARLDATGTGPVRAGTTTATISFEALPKLRLGGLLAMPQARVTIAFDGVAEAERAHFLKRFDLAFQRGGG